MRENINSNYHMAMRSIIFLTIVGLLSSCTPNDKKQNRSINLKDQFKSFDTIVSFSGCWLSEDYYNSIMQFKSPKRAQDGSQFVFIPNRTLQQTVMIYDFHEGGEFMKLLKHGNSYEFWGFQEDSLTQELYSVEIISTTKIKLGEKTFVKINPVNGKYNYRILEEILFEGKYVGFDGKSIEFKPNGQVIGLDDFTYYEPIIDYFDAGMQVDQVGLGNSENDLDLFGFKFNNDTLEIYTLNCLSFEGTDNKCVEVDYGELKYKLLRKTHN